MCFLVLIYVFMIAPLYHTQKWLAHVVEEKGQESLWFRVPYILLYLIGYVGGFILGLTLPGDSPPFVRGLFIAGGSVTFIAMMFFVATIFLPNRRKAGTTGYRDREVGDAELERFRRAKKRAAREMREHKEKLREEQRRRGSREEEKEEVEDEEDLPVLRPRGKRDEDDRPRQRRRDDDEEDDRARPRRRD